jgi:hypothetical protein
MRWSMPGVKGAALGQGLFLGLPICDFSFSPANPSSLTGAKGKMGRGRDGGRVVAMANTPGGPRRFV